MNPAARSMELLRKERWMVDRCEQWVIAPNHPAGGFRRDCFGFGDLIGVHPEQGTAIFQVTSRGALSAHWAKINADAFEMNEEPLRARIAHWLRWNQLWLHAWDAPKSMKGLAEAKAQGWQKWRLLRQQVVIKDSVLMRVEITEQEEQPQEPPHA